MLLSFAQFEREVTAERIRDKIAASKKNGLWLGGRVPFGYQVRERKQIAKEPEASLVKWLFERYLELQSVPTLAQEMTQQHKLTKSDDDVQQALGGSVGDAVPDQRH